jgi:hypothetical protein
VRRLATCFMGTPTVSCADGVTLGFYIVGRLL